MEVHSKRCELMKVVLFRRCSSRKQADAFSLDAQKAALNDYVAKNDVEVVGEFVEVGSGRKKNRPILDEAIALSKKHKATLVVARLDRAGRRAALLTNLIESDVAFLALDFPNACRLTLGIMAQIAAHESYLIGERTKAAIKVRKAAGVEWGVTGKDLAKVNKKRAKDFSDTLREPIAEIINSTRKPTLERVAHKLNARGLKTSQGKKFHSNTVRRVLKRLELAL